MNSAGEKKDLKIKKRLLGNREGGGMGYEGTIVRVDMIKVHYTMYGNAIMKLFLCKINILELNT